ncbi:uncharacterized protein LOC143021150 isoform X2 [Oratosquilla oratoria]|uniref:uncharacterized protein LOC143021150 isoform X2 n=1 Tax=Oratosquilla oratoria TaxID=337810 RepID=UPI003F776B79
MSYTQVCNYQLFVVGARRKVTENNIKRSKLSWPETPSCVTVHRRGTTRRVDRGLGVVHTALKRRSTRPPSGMSTHKYLLLLCSLIACATACSEVQVIGKGAEGHLEFSQNTVSLSYLRLDVTSKNDNVTFRVHNSDRITFRIDLVEEEDGTRVDIHYYDIYKRWVLYTEKVNRLERPRTHLKLSYPNYSIILVVNKRTQETLYRYTGIQTNNLGVYVSSTSSKLLLLSQCERNGGKEATESALQDLVETLQQQSESLDETKKELETSENSRAEVQKELDKSRENHAESHEELVKTQRELDQAQGELDQVQEELVQAHEELGQAQEKVAETQSKSTILMATTIAFGILLVIVTAAVVLVCCSPRWRKSCSGTPDTSSGGIAMATTTTQEGNPNEGFAPPGNQLKRSESFESINSIYGIANPR